MSIQFYQENSEVFFNETVNLDMSKIYMEFLKYLPKGAKILDAGCGSGRDTKAFLRLGYNVEAFDASSKLVAIARRYTGIRVKQSTFEEIEVFEKFDGIWACASLLHVPESELVSVFKKLAASLKPHGVWYVSFKYGNTTRVKDTRLFTDLNEVTLTEVLSKLKDVKQLKTWITEDMRSEKSDKWLNAIITKI